MTSPILQVQDLVVRYKPRGLFAANPPPAVNRVSLNLPAGATLGVVGESAAGKSSLLRAILRLKPVESGSVRFGGQDWLALRGPELRLARRGIGVVAQNPFLSLSPRLTIAQILSEPLLARGDRAGADMREKTASLLSRGGLPPDFLPRRARGRSCGQAQRVAIARALFSGAKSSRAGRTDLRAGCLGASPDPEPSDGAEGRFRPVDAVRDQ